MKKFLSTALFLFTTILTLGFIILLFSIGLIALFYILIIGVILLGIRWLYYFIRGKKPPRIMEQYYAYSMRNNQAQEKKRSRIIDYEDFKDK